MLKFTHFFKLLVAAAVFLVGSADCEVLTSTVSGVDCLCFSYDRPMQLHAFLTSVHKHLHGLGRVSVLYRTSDSRFEQAYNELMHSFPSVIFVKQQQPEQPSFKPQLLKLLFDQPNSPYVMFGVDDIVVTEDVDLKACVAALEMTGAYGFYLRLGKNITRCYTLAIEQDFALPPLTSVAPGMYSWRFDTGVYDWNYPNSVS